MKQLSSSRRGSLVWTVSTGLLSGCVTLLLFAGQVQAKEKKAATSSAATAPASLAGTWHGVFTRDGRGVYGETEYVVRVGAALDTIEVEALRGAAGNRELQVTTGAPVPAVLKDGVLTAEFKESHAEGKTKVEIVRHCSLWLGKDEKHAVFSYTVETATSDAKGSRHISLKGEGVLTR